MSSSRWNRIEQLFREASALPPEEWTAYLEEHCEDEALREEVLSLLETVDEASEYFDYLSSVISPAREEMRPLAGVRDVHKDDPMDLEGMQVGRYEVEACIGCGGMGVVYRARDPELDRHVALKFLSPYLSMKKGAEQRFVNEAQTASALDHPNIATIYEVGRTESGRRFIAMAYYEGQTLKEKLMEGLLPLEEALDYAIQMAGAVSAAHEAGIVHRDIKPANVMITQEGIVKVLDFGMAKLRGSAAITRSGVTPGTLAYMSPEQLRGEEVNEQSDLFSLGLVLYEMFTGAHPFVRQFSEGISHRLLHENADPPSVHKSEISRDLDQIVMRCLAKRREKRYSSASEVMHDLQTIQSLFPSGSRSHFSLGRSLPNRSRLGRKSAIALGGVGLLIVGVLMVWWVVVGDFSGDRMATSASSVEKLGPERIAVLPFHVTSAEAEPWKDDMVTMLSLNLDNAPDMQAVAARTIFATLENQGKASVALSTNDALEVAREVEAHYAVIGQAGQLGGDIRLAADVHEVVSGERLDRLEVRGAPEEVWSLTDDLTREILRILLERDIPSVDFESITTESFSALGMYLEGERHFRAGNYEAAVERFEQAVEEDPNFALAYYRLSRAAGWTEIGSRPQAAARARELSDKLPERYQRLIEMQSVRMQGHAEEAMRGYRKIVDAQAENVEAWYMLGETLFHNSPTLGQSLVEAREPFERALELDPSLNEPLRHLIEIAALERDTVRLDALTSGLDERGLPTQEEARFRAVRSVLVDGDGNLQLADPAAAPLEALALSGRFDLAGDAARLFTSNDRTPETRAAGHVMTAIYLAAQGKMEGARDELEAAAPLDAHQYLSIQAALSTLPFLPPEASGKDPQADVAEQLKGLYLPETRQNPFARAFRHYQTALLHAGEGNLSAAQDLTAEIEDTDPPEDYRSGPSDLARGVQASIQLAQNEPEEALRLLERVELDGSAAYIYLFWGAELSLWAEPDYYFSGARERFLRADLLAEVGRFDEALAWFESLAGYSRDEIPFVAPAQLGRAQALEELGRVKEAAQAYERFLELWKNADPAFEPKVQEARERLQRLSDDEI